MSVFLKGLGLQFYRGIGKKRQFMAPFQQFNFFIGANNSGKSTVLNFIHDYLPVDPNNNYATLPTGSLDLHQGKETGKISAILGIPTDDIIANVSGRVEEANRQKFIEFVTQILKRFTSRGLVWASPQESFNGGLNLYPSFRGIEPQALISEDANWSWMWRQFARGSSGGSLKDHWYPTVMSHIESGLSLNLPATRLVPAIRQIGKKDEQFGDYSGQGLIDRLAELQSPDYNARHEHQLFEKINDFLRVVLDRPDARIEIPHNRSSVLVHMDDKVLPIQALGTGIHEVIMLASFCTISSKQIICIEEPEIHLHPILQRKFIKYLQDKTDNQYFIATHSASFIDTPGAAIFHMSNDGAETSIRETVLRYDKVALCRDLGYRASDIVQANAVIWVEGPSDRIYLAHWLRRAAPDLIEGIHFSIMFYGGRLLNHLTGDPEQLEEFINLRSLNQNSAILMDSDRKASGSSINQTKQKIRDEFSKNHGFCWITKGREVENYVPYAKLQRAVKTVYGDVYDKPADGGQFDHALYFYRRKVKTSRKPKPVDPTVDPLLEKEVDKVRVAYEVCRDPADLTEFDLKKMVTDLAEFIRTANT